MVYGERDGIKQSVEGRLLVATAILGGNTEGLERALITRGVRGKDVVRLKESGRGVEPDVARRAITGDLNFIAETGLAVYSEFVNEAALAANKGLKHPIVSAAETFRRAQEVRLRRFMANYG